MMQKALLPKIRLKKQEKSRKRKRGKKNDGILILFIFFSLDENIRKTSTFTTKRQDKIYSDFFFPSIELSQLFGQQYVSLISQLCSLWLIGKNYRYIFNSNEEIQNFNMLIIYIVKGKFSYTTIIQTIFYIIFIYCCVSRQLLFKNKIGSTDINIKSRNSYRNKLSVEVQLNESIVISYY